MDGTRAGNELRSAWRKEGRDTVRGAGRLGSRRAAPGHKTVVFNCLQVHHVEEGLY